jgi:hypothetical protein
VAELIRDERGEGACLGAGPVEGLISGNRRLIQATAAHLGPAARFAGLTFGSESPSFVEPASGERLAVNLLEAFGAAEEATQDRIMVYVPSRDRDGKPADFEPWVARALALLSEVGGGATRMPPAQGAWLNRETDTLIVEDVTLVYSYVDGDALASRLADVRALLHGIGRALDQGEVVVEINDTLYKIREFDE